MYRRIYQFCRSLEYWDHLKYPPRSDLVPFLEKVCPRLAGRIKVETSHKQLDG